MEGAMIGGICEDYATPGRPLMTLGGNLIAQRIWLVSKQPSVVDDAKRP